MRLVLLHSPLVGPTTWAPVAHLLRRAGAQVVVPDIRAAVTARPPYQSAISRSVAEALAAAPDGAPLVLVGHSGAGPLLPGIADTSGIAVQALIYVDAGLPRPGTNWFERAPGDRAEHLRRLAAGGVLPPWDEWFETGAVDALISDPELRSRFRHELPRLPVAFLAEPTPPAVWAGPSGYLLLSEGYRTDADKARGNGWPVLEKLSHHLGILTQPADVADALNSLCRVLVTDSGRRSPRRGQ